MFSFFKKPKKAEEDLLNKIDKSRLPQHIAIIMDGNGRWARHRNLPRAMGHKAGVEAIRDIVRASSELGIKVLTLYAFSTENWKRPADEVNALMNLLVEYLRKEVQELHEKKVKIMAIGDITKLPLMCQQELKNAFNITKNNDGLVLNLALNYGSRNEIISAVRKISADVKKGSFDPEKIDESLISRYLSTKNLPDPDLIIRPSGELRLSNFLLWQCAYSELWFSDVNWPDFKRNHLYKAIYDFQIRDRRFGGIKQ
ncbi:isoprenyl transferase [Oxobacter pfennigii]|uniref:Isoprenyl transferase n=1 Tax=Oxobacter pfennigii TaxID=36849 RepID=A0A0P8W836_9CLOT|nr:isoprenyl transferase [Oxobacter pfennigii]KPU43913.1 isoprenyl transferase [Oxobacter pfennigii]